MEDILFFDLEIGLKDYKVYDIGAVCTDGREFHQSSLCRVCFVKQVPVRAQYSAA